MTFRVLRPVPPTLMNGNPVCQTACRKPVPENIQKTEKIAGLSELLYGRLVLQNGGFQEMFRKMINLIPLFTLLCGGLSAQAQDSTLVLKEGTEVKLKFAQDISSKTAASDDPVEMVLDEDIKVGEVVVAKGGASGAKALAIVSHSKKAGMMGKGGELNIRLEYIKIGDKRVRLRGTKSKEGDSKVGTTVALTVLFGPIGLIKHGKDINVKQGTALTAFVSDDAQVSAAK